MTALKFISWAVGFVLLHTSYACSTIQLQSIALGSRLFTPLPDESSRQIGLETGRASYVSDSPNITDKLFLYHVILDGGVGRWVMSDMLGETSLAVGYVNSWAIMPTLIHSLGAWK